MRRSETDTALSRLTAAQRRIHADVQMHGVRTCSVRSLPSIERLAAAGLVEYEYSPLHDIAVKVRLPASESARLKGPWRRDELAHQRATGQEPDSLG
jgi:hypothetical protein